MSVEIITSFDQICDASGDPMSGAKIYVYDVGTTTPRNVYAASDLSGSAAANPIVTDSAGRHDMRYTATGSYKIVVKTSADVTVYTRDNIDGRVPVGGTGILAIANGGTGASTAAGALAALSAPTAAEVADLAAQVAALAGSAASTEKTHIATGTTAQRPAAPADGDIRRNTTIPQWEGYSGAAAAWQKLAVATEVTTEIAVTIGTSYFTTATASSSTVIDITTNLTDTYESYFVELTSVKPVTDDVSLNIRVGTGGGPTYQTSGYSTGAVCTGVGATATIGGTAQAAIITTNVGSSNGIGNASGEHVRGRVKFSNPEGTDFLLIEWDLSLVSAAGTPVRTVGAGMWATAGAVTGIRFMMSSGNIASGTFRHYGVRKT